MNADDSLTGEGDVVVPDALLGEAVEGAVAEPPLVDLPSAAAEGGVPEDDREGRPDDLRKTA